MYCTLDLIWYSVRVSTPIPHLFTERQRYLSAGVSVCSKSASNLRNALRPSGSCNQKLSGFGKSPLMYRSRVRLEMPSFRAATFGLPSDLQYC